MKVLGDCLKVPAAQFVENQRQYICTIDDRFGMLDAISCNVRVVQWIMT